MLPHYIYKHSTSDIASHHTNPSHPLLLLPQIVLQPNNPASPIRKSQLVGPTAVNWTQAGFVTSGSMSDLQEYLSVYRRTVEHPNMAPDIRIPKGYEIR